MTRAAADQDVPTRFDLSFRPDSYVGGEPFDGAEYGEPSYKDEFVVVTVTLDSVLGDAYGVLARRTGSGWRYRVTTFEEPTDETITLPFDSSAAPLTLGEMVSLIDGADAGFGEWGGGLVFGPLAYNFEACGDAEELDGFVTVTSACYPDIAELYEEAIGAWLASQEPPSE